MEIVDGYTHCGVSKYEPIERVADVMSAAGVRWAVLVQHLGEFDNAYLGRIAAADPERFAAVCLVDHQAPDCVQTLRRWVDSGCFRGLRLTAEALATRPDLADAAAALGLVLVLYAPGGIAPVARPLAELLRRYPEAPLVVSHLGHPDAADSPRFANSEAMWRLADHANVYIQLSGMKLFCPWPHEPLYPLIAEALERFGAARLYWGSNFPVVGDARDYRGDLALLVDGKLPLKISDIPAVAGETAKSLWFSHSTETTG